MVNEQPKLVDPGVAEARCQLNPRMSLGAHLLYRKSLRITRGLLQRAGVQALALSRYHVSPKEWRCALMM